MIGITLCVYICMQMDMVVEERRKTALKIQEIKDKVLVSAPRSQHKKMEPVVVDLLDNFVDLDEDEDAPSLGGADEGKPPAPENAANTALTTEDPNNVKDGMAM